MVFDRFNQHPLKRVPPRKRYCIASQIGLARCNSVSRHGLCAADWVSSLKEPAMNGTSGFRADCRNNCLSRLAGSELWIPVNANTVHDAHIEPQGGADTEHPC